MNNKRPKNAKSGEWKPGASGNLKGRPKFDLQEHLEVFPRLSDSYVRKVLSKLCLSSRADLETILSRNSGPAIEQVAAKLIIEAIELGDHKKLDFILDRVIGKVTIPTEITSPKPTVIKFIGGGGLLLGNQDSEDTGGE